MKASLRNTLLLFTLAAGPFQVHAQRARQTPANPPASAAEADPRNWRVYAPPGEGFSVQLPGKSRGQTQQTPRPDGTATARRVHSLKTFAEYGVKYEDYPFAISGAEEAQRILDAGAQGAVAEANAELLESKEISLGGRPGRALKEKLPDGRIMRVRMYLVGSRLYQLAITTPKEDDAPAFAIRFYEATANRFFDSFKLTGARASARRAPSNETDQPPPPLGTEGEVDKLAKELKARNVMVLGACGDLEKCKPLPGNTKLKTGELISKPQPAYPAIAKAARATGGVVVQLIVDKEGKVIAAQAISGHPLLQAAAVKAARETLFTPTLLDGKPVMVSGVITYNFALQ
jgi:TonB family protein